VNPRLIVITERIDLRKQRLGEIDPELVDQAGGAFRGHTHGCFRSDTGSIHLRRDMTVL
jgi:hypothetical protein